MNISAETKANRTSNKKWVTAGNGIRLWSEASGQGKPLLVLGGIGSGIIQRTPVASLLGKHVRLISFDRRASGRSLGGGQTPLCIRASVHDVLSVLDAHDIRETTIFSTCASSAIALELIQTAPSRVKHLIIHEPLLTPLLETQPEKQKYENYKTVCLEQGPVVAMGHFLNDHELPFPEVFQKACQRDGNQWIQYEFLPLVQYEPDIPNLEPHKHKITLLAGQQSTLRNLAFARIALKLSQMLGVSLKPCVGHHSVYHFTPDEFVDHLLSLLP